MYRVFVSYLECDKKWARRLIWKLERFRFPSRMEDNLPTRILICQEARLPVEKRPLWNGEGADCLVVVCSRKTSLDNRIFNEINAFHIANRAGRIIPYVIEGKPYAEMIQDECLPSVFRSRNAVEAFAVNEQEIGSRHALLRTIATMFDLPLNILTARASMIQRRAMFAVILSVTLIFAIFAYIICEEYQHYHKEYYLSYDYRYGVPHGIGRLFSFQKMNVDSYYTFVVAENRVIRVEQSANYKEKTSKLSYQSAIDTPNMWITYHTDGTLDTIVHLDKEGVPVFYMNYLAGNSCADFSYDIAGFEPYQLVLFGEETDITRCKYTYDRNGYIEYIQFMKDSRNTPSTFFSGGMVLNHND